MNLFIYHHDIKNTLDRSEYIHFYLLLNLFDNTKNRKTSFILILVLLLSEN